MPQLIDNETTRKVLETRDAVDALEDAFRQLANDEAVYQPLTNIVSPVTPQGETYNWDEKPEFYNWGSHLAAIMDPPRLALRFKSDIRYREMSDGVEVSKKYNVEPGMYMGFIVLIDTSTGAIIGLLNDGELQHIRVGATAGIACDYFSRKDASTVGILGSGGMARTYLEAFCAVRDIDDVSVYSPTEAHRETFAKEMSERLGITIRAVDDPETAMRNVDIAATCTDARSPVYFEDWLSPGTFLTNTSSSELSDGVYDKVDKIATTHNQPNLNYVIGGKEHSQRYRDIFPDRLDSEELVTITDFMDSTAWKNRGSDETVLFNNVHMGIQFAAIGNLVYEKVEEQGLGMEIPLSWFQQDVRN